MEYFRIKNWDKYQPRKKYGRGNMHFLQLDTAALDDPKTAQMTNAQFGVFARLLLWARRMDNKMPHDERWLSARLAQKSAHRRANFRFLWDLGLLETVSEDGEKRREEKSIVHTQNVVVTSAVGVPKIPDKDWDEIWESYPRSTKKIGVTSQMVARGRLALLNLDPGALNEFKSAVKAYAAAAADQEPRFVRNFERFITNDYWREYVTKEEAFQPSKDRPVFW